VRSITRAARKGIINHGGKEIFSSAGEPEDSPSSEIELVSLRWRDSFSLVNEKKGIAAER